MASVTFETETKMILEKWTVVELAGCAVRPTSV